LEGRGGKTSISVAASPSIKLDCAAAVRPEE
jgi:hypothetical protein